MKSFNDFKQQINEVLKASDPIDKWISDFVHSTNPKFAGKSKAERIDMAKGAYYGAQRNESVAVSQNSTAEQEMNEERDVHVNDGSKYDEEPHPKDVEHIMAGVKKHGGKHAGNSDKGVYFRFKSKEDADAFRAHVNKCPHHSCDADHVEESVEYKGIGTDIVDKKKVLNPQPNLMSDKKQVKDFKEEVEEIEEGDNGLAAKAKKSGVSLSTLKTVYKRGVAAWNSGHRPGTTPAQWGMARVNSYITKGSGTYGGADKDLHEDARLTKPEYQKGMSASMAKARVAHWKKADKLSDSNPKAYEPAPGDKTAKTTPSVHTKKYHAMYGEAKVYDPITKKMVASKPIKVQAGGGATRNGVPVETGPSKYKQGLKEEQIDELSKTTLQSYRKKVAKDVGRAYAIHQDPYKKTDKDDMRKLSNRVKGDERAEIGLKKEEVQIDEVSKSTLMRYIPAASRAAAQHVYTGKEAQTWAGHAMRANDYASSEHQLAIHKKEMGKSIKRLKGIDTATKKLGTKKTYEEFVRGLGESYDHGPIDRDAKLAVGHKAAVLAGSGLDSGKHGTIVGSSVERTGPHWHIKTSNGDIVKMHKHRVAKLKEEVEHIEEATVATRSYDWGKMKVVHQGKSFNIPLHPEHHEAIAKLNDGESTHVKTEDGKTWKASREGDDVHFSNLRGQKASVKHSQMTESRGHKVLATFFKNREVAQRAFTGQNKPENTEKGIETPKVEKQEKLKEDQYTADYKIKYYVDPITGENKTRKIRPHRVDFKNSKMRGEPAQKDAEGDYGAWKEGFDNYNDIAKELIKRHGKNIDTGHINDLAGERDTHRGLDHAEVMHHVNKILDSRRTGTTVSKYVGKNTVKEGEEDVYDEKWKAYKGASFKKNKGEK